jgi:phenylacetate-coenzyme A ligase PaaK-like adenylate-forming protein
MLSAQSATSRLVESLNSFNPAVIAGFPSVLSRMADERIAGRLKVNPVCMVAEGEFLEEDVRKKISDAFKCDVTSSYSTAETGIIAYECREHHLHINDDWVILEPVDAAGRPVKAGIESDKVLITNLLSYPAPIIRYELGDKVILHESDCLCGNPSPWIEIAGRSLDQIRFVDGIREIVVPVADLDAVLKGEPSIRRYQIVVYAGNRIALRLTGAKGTDKTMAFFKAEKLMRAYMKSIGIMSPMITLDKEDPGPDPLSGKFKRIIIE